VSRALSEGEVDLSDAMLARVGALAEAAAARGVRLMVDAEHTYFQPVRRGGRRKQRIG
jgi:proline dehydrogenase